MFCKLIVSVVEKCWEKESKIQCVKKLALPALASLNPSRKFLFVNFQPFVKPDSDTNFFFACDLWWGLKKRNGRKFEGKEDHQLRTFERVKKHWLMKKHNQIGCQLINKKSHMPHISGKWKFN
jgi:hypothetical protein